MSEAVILKKIKNHEVATKLNNQYQCKIFSLSKIIIGNHTYVLLHFNFFYSWRAFERREHFNELNHTDMKQFFLKSKLFAVLIKIRICYLNRIKFPNFLNIKNWCKVDPKGDARFFNLFHSRYKQKLLNRRVSLYYLSNKTEIEFNFPCFHLLILLP